MPYVSVEADGDVALVRMDRPPANAMDLDLLAEGHAVVAELDSSAPAAVVLTGRDGFFSAGADLKAVPALAPEDQRGMVEGINRIFLAWYAMERPVVCAVNGHAVAGGMILALCGDYRVGSTQGKLGVTEVRVGLPYPAAALAVLQAELAPPAARRLALQAGLVDPPEALALGLVDELAEPESVLPRALEVAHDLASMPGAAYAITKRDLRGPVVERVRGIIEAGTDPLLAGWMTAGGEDAARAVLDG
jgi:enoyl-CoA hydratase